MEDYNSEAWIDSNIEFSADIFSRLSNQTGNLIISPLSILSTLYLLLHGTRGALRPIIGSTLKLPNATNDQSLSNAITNFNALQKSLDRSKSFTQSDRVFIDQHSVDDIQDGFKDVVGLIDFNNKEVAVNSINEWVASNSAGLIKELLPPGGIPDDLKLMLINLVLFKGVWDKKFDSDFIFKSKFKNFDGSTSLVEFMYTEEKNYYADLHLGEHNVQVVALKYSSSNLAMMIVLPKHTEALDDLVLNLSEYQKDLLSTALRFTKVELQIPKFKLDTTINLSSALKDMGLREAFDKGGDFSGIINATEPLKIGNIEHVVTIDVNEDGTEVAAATKIDIVAYSLNDNDDPKMVVNRPFLFYIIDQESKLPVFMGIVKQLETVA